MIIVLTDVDLAAKIHSLRIYLSNLIKGLVRYSKVEVVLAYKDKLKLSYIMSKLDRRIQEHINTLHVFKLGEMIKNIDIIHIPSVFAGAYVNPFTYIPLLLKPAVITIHGISPLRAPTFDTKLANIKWHTLFSITKTFFNLAYTFKKLIHYNTIIVVPSNSAKVDIEKYLTRQIKIIVINHGVDEEIFNAYSPTDTELVYTLTNGRPYFLHVSNMSPLKNVIALIYAYKKFLSKMKTFMHSKDVPLLVIVYDVKSSYVHKITKLINSLSLKGDILLLSELDNRTLASFYRNALAYIHPSLYESYGYTIAEALMSGAPVIASRYSSCASEVFYKYVVLIDNPLNINEIYQKILYVYNNHDEIKDNILKNYNDILMKASLKTMTLKYLNAYSNVIERG